MMPGQKRGGLLYQSRAAHVVNIRAKKTVLYEAKLGVKDHNNYTIYNGIQCWMFKTPSQRKQLLLNNTKTTKKANPTFRLLQHLAESTRDALIPQGTSPTAVLLAQSAGFLGRQSDSLELTA